VIGLLLFIWRELKTDRPAVDLKILKNIPFASGTVLGGVLGLGLFGTLFLLPVFLQNLLGFPALKSGVAMLPRSIASAVVGPIGGRLYNRLGPRLMVAIGLLLNAYGFWAFSHLTSQVGAWDIFWPQVWQGAGMGLLFVAIATAALATIPRPRMTAATGLYNVVRQVSASIGIAIAATQIDWGTHRFHALLAEHVTIYAEGTRRMLSGITAALVQAGADPGTAALRAVAILNRRVTQQAAVLAYNHIFQLVALLFVLSVPLVFLLTARPPGIAPRPARPAPAGPAAPRSASRAPDLVAAGPAASLRPSP
jgi:DHA2 family multidrug resistance protein